MFIGPREIQHFPNCAIYVTNGCGNVNFCNVHILLSSHSFNGKPISNTIKKLISRSMLLKKGIAASVLWTKIVCVRYGPHVYPSISMSHLPTLWGCQKTLVDVLYIFWQSIMFFLYSTLWKFKKRMTFFFWHVHYLLLCRIVMMIWIKLRQDSPKDWRVLTWLCESSKSINF